MKTTNDVVTYIRVSTKEQAEHGYSLETQRDHLHAYAERHGLHIVKEFVEKESAFVTGRSVFDEMAHFLKTHGTIAAVLFDRYDRVTRNLPDYAAILTPGVPLVAVTQELPDDATGEFMATLHVGMARLYSQQLAERVSNGLQTKAERGCWPSGPMAGYIMNPLAKGIIPDPARAPIIRALFEVYASGTVSIVELRDYARDVLHLRTLKGNSLTRSAIHKILTNPVYCGLFEWAGKIYEGTHEAIISRKLFDDVQRRLNAGAHRKGERDFPYRGLLRCGECGCKITAEEHKGHTYYHCTRGRGPCSQPWIREDRLGEALGVTVQSLVASDQCRDYAIATARERYRAAKEHQEKGRLQAERELERLTHLRDTAYADKVAGTLSQERWQEMDLRWEAQVRALRGNLSDLESSQCASEEEETRTAFELLESSSRLYNSQSHHERARLLRTVLSNGDLKDGNVVPYYKPPFDKIAQYALLGTG